MLDYTDISSKVEDVKNSLNSLYELVYSQYDGIFQGEDAEKYQRMLQGIKSADRCMNEVDELNNCVLRTPAVADAVTNGRGAVVERSAGGDHRPVSTCKSLVFL